MNGFDEGKLILIDKPYGRTSFNVVSYVRRKTRAKKVGHAGTLDPLATGLLLLCTGKWTRKISELQIMEKEYTGTFTLGAIRPSFDMETEIEATSDISGINVEEIFNAAKNLTGKIMQVPPVYSAIKVNGRRAYESARTGEIIQLNPREVEIMEFEITGIELPEVQFRVVCSKGTYIRTLASDFGKLLGVGAYLSSLRRTRIGNYHVNDALTPEQFAGSIVEI